MRGVADHPTPRARARAAGLLGCGRGWASTTPRARARAADLGFADQSHLAGAFRAACGMSPSAYRRSLEALING